jgi:hypothetical protein
VNISRKHAVFSRCDAKRYTIIVAEAEQTVVFGLEAVDEGWEFVVI